MAMVLMFVRVSCTTNSLIFSVSFRISIDGMCVEPLAFAVKTRSGGHSILYFECFVVMGCIY